MIPDPDAPGTETAPEPNPWERHPGETTKSFGAFATYRDLGYMRTHRAAATLFYPTSGDCTAPQLQQFKDWSAANDWVARAEAWDDYLDAINRAQQAQDVVDMNRVHATVGRNLIGRVQAQLREMVEGSTPIKLTASELARWLDIGVKVERLARGEATTVTTAQVTLEGEGHDAQVARAEALIDEVDQMRQRREATGG